MICVLSLWWKHTLLICMVIYSILSFLVFIVSVTPLSILIILFSKCFTAFGSSSGMTLNTPKIHFLPNNRGELFSTIFCHFCYCLPGYLDDHYVKNTRNSMAANFGKCRLFYPDFHCRPLYAWLSRCSWRVLCGNRLVLVCVKSFMTLIFGPFSAIFAASFTVYFFGLFRSFVPVVLFHKIFILSNLPQMPWRGEGGSFASPEATSSPPTRSCCPK